MAFQPSDSLRSRTFLGLILAQFLAAFNDQAIHASAMFFAIHKNTMTAKDAISLMPILFFAPWAIFCTLAGYFADRYSKRNSLVFWKFAEIGICAIAFFGFWVGSVHSNHWGPYVVFSCVFLMGTHSAFFVPAKYGAMPEILEPQQLSKGNGVLESTSFLAIILGTVAGGVMSWGFRNEEYLIGTVLLILAGLGALASLLIRPIPAANPTRPFPKNLVKPLIDNLRTFLRSRPLALSVLGIAFFTFMVTFMRSTMYMHGEAQNPRWDEFEISLVAGTVALGVGLGSPLAGVLSGGKVELGLVPLGAVGMIVAGLMAAAAIFWLPALVFSIILIGFFSGFYIVPLYTLLQHRAPKTSKGDLIATSNFINVTGAIAASLLFYLLVFAARSTGVAKAVPQTDVVQGGLVNLERHQGHPVYFQVQEDEDGAIVRSFGQRLKKNAGPIGVGDRLLALFAWMAGANHRTNGEVITVAEGLKDGAEVAVSKYDLRGVAHYEVRPAGQKLEDAYDQERVPQFLFVGASAMTLGILILLCRQLPDFFVRALLWLRSHGSYRLRAIGLNNLPADGPVILATNCDRFQECMQVVAATDRFTRFVLLESDHDDPPRPLLRYLARRTGLVVLRSGDTGPDIWEKALLSASRTLDSGCLLAVTLVSGERGHDGEAFFRELQARRPVRILPVYCGALRPPANGQPLVVRRVRVVIGHSLPPTASPEQVKHAVQFLGEWLHGAEHTSASLTTLMIPAAAGASPTMPAPSLPKRP